MARGDRMLPFFSGSLMVFGIAVLFIESVFYILLYGVLSLLIIIALSAIYGEKHDHA